MGLLGGPAICILIHDIGSAYVDASCMQILLPLELEFLMSLWLVIINKKEFQVKSKLAPEISSSKLLAFDTIV